MHAGGPGADERLQESAAMIANYPARVPVCEPSPFPCFFPLPSQALGRKGLPLLLFFVFTSLARRLVVDHTALGNFHRVLLLFFHFRLSSSSRIQISIMYSYIWMWTGTNGMADFRIQFRIPSLLHTICWLTEL